MITIGSIRKDGNHNTVFQTEEDTLQGVLRRERKYVRSLDVALDVINKTLDLVDVK